MASQADAAGDNIGYLPTAGRHDEAVTGQGDFREHWRYLLGSLQTLGPAAVNERQAKAHRILRDDGAIYHVYGDASGQGRVWPLDPVPLLIESEEWRAIEAGILERSEVLNLMLRDLYGPRELIKHRVIPPELILHDRSFRRACQGIRLPGEHELIVHATDMARGPDDRMWAIGDRTQAPSGAGYALENRVVMARVFPSLYRDSHVHRLAMFFRVLRNTLNRVVPPHAVNPRIVVLTPGPFNETYFEHAYLANYLGYPLVQGGDLVCQDGYVWMRSVTGLDRVDAVVRRVDDNYCDPVEFKGDSQLGVAGLLEVARMGRVAIVNPLGSGVIENPALLKYMTVIGRHFLGREPRLPTVKTWWCGDDADREYVLNHLERLVVKPTVRTTPLSTRFGASLSAGELAALRAQIVAHPLAFVAQEPILPSTVPSWRSDGLQPRPAVVRSFAVAGEGGYVVMPGGLTRVGASLDASIVSNQTGSVSKDTWVLASEPEKQARPGERKARITTFDQPTSLPARAVENLYWLARYAERAESSIRLLRTVFVLLNRNLLAGNALPNNARNTLLTAVTDLTTAYPGFRGDDADDLFDSPDAELMSVMLDAQRSGSVAANLNSMLRCAAAVQEQLSADTQRVINDIEDELQRLNTDLATSGLSAAPEEALDPLITALMALSGLTHESMIRGTGWRFMDMGRRIERALLTSALMRSTLYQVADDVDEALIIEAVLLSMENLISYRRRYHASAEVARGLELLMMSASNPRSLLYQLERLRTQVAVIPGNDQQTALSTEARLVLEAVTLTQLADVDELSAVNEKTAGREALHQLLARITHLVSEISEELSRRFFEHAQPLQQLVQSSDEIEP